MRFYYISIFSILLLGLIYLIGTGLLTWFGLWLRKRWKRSWMLMVPLFLLLYAGPVAEEFWIALNFGKLCKKDAGRFIYKIVEVDGYYDATGATLDSVRPGRYKFIESFSSSGKGAVHVSVGDENLKRQAFSQYEKDAPGKSAAEQEIIRVILDERTEALVYPKKGDSWRITRLEHPTARYHYTTNIYGTNVAHKITRQESTVSDQTTGEVIGRYVEYGRRPPWFFIGLGEAPYSCDGPDGGPNSKYNRLIYREVLLPMN